MSLLAEIGPGDPSSDCDVCGDHDLPNIRVYTHFNRYATYVCIRCVAGAIDSVTGWRFANNVAASLNLSDATERFRHPERFAARKAGRPRKSATGEQE